MTWVVRGVGVLILLASVVWGIGSQLPQGHVVSRTTRLAAPPDRVFALISDVAAGPSWRTGLERVEVLPPVRGRSRYRETADGENLTMEVETNEPDRRRVTRIVEEGQPFGGTWTFDLEPDGAGTRLTITERGEVYSSLFRFVQWAFLGYTGTMEQYLADLERRLARP